MLNGLSMLAEKRLKEMNEMCKDECPESRQNRLENGTQKQRKGYAKIYNDMFAHFKALAEANEEDDEHKEPCVKCGLVSEIIALCPNGCDE